MKGKFKMRPLEMSRENYKALKDRIKRASGNTELLDKVQVSIDRIYNAGQLTARDLIRLDGLILNEHFEISEG